ncbi:uncharacterized protein LOC111359779 isoform X2 [Spodoptera litura]|uniref:Uncharacterized protein LOC111359779 isoform X2 n=1 Tax=Spodoptera litura TaxID=69820 RepID=A0A9J7EMF9_SPOLT|nr:uncharacterized protein LOC111359779 isoform X2 [Spodoptera litura]
MDAELVKTLLESIKMAISTNRRQDDMALPSFDPEKMHNGAESWCKNIEDLGAEFNWSSLQMVAKADHRRHSKLSPKFKGPYEILEILQNDRYRLRGQGRLHNIVIAKEKLRKWQGEWSEENQTAEQALTDNDSSDEE